MVYMLFLEIDEGKIKVSVQPNQAQSWIRQIIVDNSAVMSPCSEKPGFASEKNHPKTRSQQQKNQTPNT